MSGASAAVCIQFNHCNTISLLEVQIMYTNWLDASPDVILEEPMDETLVANSRACSLFAKGVKDVRVDPDGNQFTGGAAERRAPDSSGACELFIGKLRDVGEVDAAAARTPLVLSGSRAAR